MRSALGDALDMASILFSPNAQGSLAQWAWSFDMDDQERHAAQTYGGAGRGQRLAWQPLALWGPAPSTAALRKLRRSAMARMDTRDLSAELGWEALEHSPEHVKSLRQTLGALGALSEPGRSGALWVQAREQGALDAKPLESQAAYAALCGLAWGSRSWQRAAWSAMAGMDWDDSQDEWMAARALSMIEREMMGEASGAGAERLMSQRL
jgi:hypothetical protein